MSNRKIKRFLLINATLAVLGFSGIASAQVTGDLIEPDVLLLIDSSGSMDWRDNEDPGGLGPWYWSEQACLADQNTASDKTAWQKMLDAFLGDIDGNNYRCSVEPPQVRPSLYGILPDDADLTDDAIQAIIDPYVQDLNADGIPDAIYEYRHETSWSHFRAVNCPENSLDPDNEFWNQNSAGYYQCIDTSVSGGVTEMANGFFCRVEDLYVKDGIENCVDLHPAARRQTNGILDRYENSVRFGFMTYDSKPIDNKAWDYGVCRDWICEAEGESSEHLCPQWNAGGRSDASGTVGGLVRLRSNLTEANNEVRTALETMEPLFCSPLGALLDDAGYYFSEDKEVLPSVVGVDGEDAYYRCRPKIALLITDGRPTGAFEFTAGGCGGTNEDVWKPNIHDTSTSCGGDPADMECPWRSSVLEAAEIYDVGQDALRELPASAAAAEADRPVFLVVIGFNVPDIDCEVDPDKCYAYTPEYSLTRRCWPGLPECEADEDTDADDDTVCLMNPKQFLNEVACQGWPYDAINNYNGEHKEENYSPPWLSDTLGICAPQGTQPEDLNNFICSYENSEFGDQVDRALFVNNTDKLQEAIGLVINDISAASTTRTEVVTHNVFTGDASDGTVAQWEFSTGYSKNSVEPWKGILKKEDLGCSAGALVTLRTDDVGESLENQSSRKFFSMSVPDDGTILDDTYYNDLTPTNIAAWVNQTPSGFETSDLMSGDFNDCDFGVGADIGDASCDNSTLVKDKVVPMLETRGLADIYNSTPAVLGPPLAWGRASSFIEYASENGTADGRDTYLFVGTNDGVLHAFNVDSMDNGAADNEKWGYIPRSLLQRVRQHFPMPEITSDGSTYTLGDDPDGGLYTQLPLFDGSPVARDVILARDPGKSGEESGDQWRAAVFGGVGKGAHTYYALDTTAALKTPSVGPRVMWEISPEEYLYANNDDESKMAIDKMGYPISKPALAYVQDDDTDLLVAAAILPGGWKSDAETTGVYITRLGDGKVLRYLEPGLATGDPNTSDICLHSDRGLLENEYAQLIGQPVVVDGTVSNRRARIAFIGDDRGRLWLINMEESDPENWCLELYFDSLVSWHFPYVECWPRNPGDTLDPYSACTPSPDTCFHTDCCATDHGEQVVPSSKCALNAESPRNMNGPRVMVLGAPTIAKDEQNKPVIVFGTGQYDELSSWNRNRIFSITDERDANRNHYAKINWWVGDHGLEKGDTGFPSFSPPETWLDDIEQEMIKTQVVAKSSWSGGAEEPKYLFNVGEKLIGKASIFDEVAYFTTFVPIEDPLGSLDPCLAGTSRIWAIDFNAKVCQDSNDEGCEYTAADFEDPYETFLGEFTQDSKNRLFMNYPSELLTGVKVVRRPVCGDPHTDSAFELVSQKSTANSSGGGGANQTEPTITTERISITKNPTTSRTRVQFDSWSIVFD